MEIPWQKLEPTTLKALISEFVSRDGTDYGETDVSHDDKITQVHRGLLAGVIKLVFDSETESTTFIQENR